MSGLKNELSQDPQLAGAFALRQDPAEQNMTYLLKMAPGSLLPAHDHSQDEECLVVNGRLIASARIANAYR